MSDQFDDKLVRMANQIARNLAADGTTEEIAASACAHITRFWSPLMKRHIVDHLRQHDGAGLDPVARLAVEKLAP